VSRQGQIEAPLRGRGGECRNINGLPKKEERRDHFRLRRSFDPDAFGITSPL